MNDDFLRHLRPRPRAAFVHELKGKLDRLPRTRPLVSGPAYLRTLMVALLLGGAAFAVTMLSSRHEPIAARGGAVVSQTRATPDETARRDGSAPVAQSGSDELTPATVRAKRRDSGPPELAATAPSSQQAAGRLASASDGSAVAESPAPPTLAGIAAVGEGIHTIRGAGGDFPRAIYAEWARQYLRAESVSVMYDGTGSGGGLKMLQSRRVTFAAVDAPMQAAELKASGMFQFPVVAGGVVPIVTLHGVKASQLRLDAGTLARIYLGEISRWSDPAIAKLNPDITLPDTRITLASRLDGSVTTHLFTDYLSRNSPGFRGRYGTRYQIDVSPGASVRGDEEMADLVDRTDGAIGYLDYTYSKQYRIESIRLINSDGKSVAATPESIQSAVAHADWLAAPAFAASLVDLPGEKTWPLSSASFVVMQGQVNPVQTAAAVMFFDWAYRDGSKSAVELGYVPIPPTVATHVRALWVASVGK